MRDILEEILKSIFQDAFAGAAEWGSRRFLVRDRALLVGGKRVLAYSTYLKAIALACLLLVVGIAAWTFVGQSQARATYLIGLGIALLPILYWVIEAFTRRISFDRRGFTVQSWRGTSDEISWDAVSSWKRIQWRDVYELETQRGVIRLSSWLGGVDEFLIVMKRRRGRKSKHAQRRDVS